MSLKKRLLPILFEDVEEAKPHRVMTPPPQQPKVIIEFPSAESAVREDLAKISHKRKPLNPKIFECNFISDMKEAVAGLDRHSKRKQDRAYRSPIKGTFDSFNRKAMEVSIAKGQSIAIGELGK